MKKSNNKSNRVYNYCSKCGRIFPHNIQYCEICNEKLFPIPYQKKYVKLGDVL